MNLCLTQWPLLLPLSLPLPLRAPLLCCAFMIIATPRLRLPRVFCVSPPAQHRRQAGNFPPLSLPYKFVNHNPNQISRLLLGNLLCVVCLVFDFCAIYLL